MCAINAKFVHLCACIIFKKYNYRQKIGHNKGVLELTDGAVGIHKTEMVVKHFRMDVSNTLSLSRLLHAGECFVTSDPTAQRCHQQRTRENSVIQQFSFSRAKLLAGLLNAWYLGDIWLCPVTHCPPLISQLHSRHLDKWVLYFTSVQRGQRPHTALYLSRGNGCAPSGSWEERSEQPTLALP